MSANFKIAGILIENSFKSNGTISSVIGIGLNVNQTDFVNLPKASSMAVLANDFFDKEEILLGIVAEMEKMIASYDTNAVGLWDEYANELFKIGVPAAFTDEYESNFMGIIKGVSGMGKLQILLEDDSICEYNLKEVQMLY